MASQEQLEGNQIERNLAFLMRQSLRESGEVSEAHGITHLKTTAKMTELGGMLYGFSYQEYLLAYGAGIGHDWERSPSEDPTERNELASARKLTGLMVRLNQRGLFSTTNEERDEVGFAVENHGETPGFFLDPATRDETPSELGDRIHASLFIADKIEANGARVIARRASFVAGDRLNNPQGDWQKFGYRPDKDEALVVAIESMLRLGVINPQYIYPEKIRKIIDPLYEVQREFVRGVFKARGLQISDIAELLLDRKRDDGKNMLQVRKLGAPSDPHELAAFLSERTGVSDASIGATSRDVADSALEAVRDFSQTPDLDGLIETWKPRGRAAKRWVHDMREYANGNWYNQARAQLAALLQ